jgi:hypothetical protein
MLVRGLTIVQFLVERIYHFHGTDRSAVSASGTFIQIDETGFLIYFDREITLLA